MNQQSGHIGAGDRISLGGVIAAIAVLVAGAAASVTGFRMLSAQELERARSSFDLAAQGRIAAVRREVDIQFEQLRATVDVYRSSERVERDEFASFTARGLAHRPALRSVFWARRVSNADRATFERDARAAGLEGFQITEPAGATSMRAAERSDYYPVWYLASQRPETPTIGTDLASVPDWRAALEAARASSGLSVTAPWESSLDSEPRTSFLALLPIYEDAAAPPGTSAPRRASLVGFLGGRIDVADLLAAAVPDLRDGPIALSLRDEGAEPGMLFGRAAPAPDAADEPIVTRSLQVGGREWEVRCTPRGGLEGLTSRRAGFALVGGLFISLLLAASVAGATSHRRVHALVRRRTEQVDRANTKLVREIVEHVELAKAHAELEEQLRQIIDLVPQVIYAKDLHGRFLLANDAAAAAFGSTVEELTGGGPFFSPALAHPPRQLNELDRKVIDSGRPVQIPAETFVDAAGRRRLFRTTRIPFVAFGDEQPAVLCVSIDITDERHAEVVQRSQNAVLREIAEGAPLEQVLETLVKGVEEALPDTLASVLILDEDGLHLRHGAAPSLPDFYNQAVDGLEIGPTAGSCGAAAFTRERVVVGDVLEHPNWAAFRDLARAAEVRASWSQPILGADGAVLGTFAMYYRRPRTPQPHEIDFIESAAHLAGIALDHSRAEEVRDRLQAQLRQIIDLVPHMIFAKDHEGRFLLVNRAVAQAYGTTVEALTGKLHGDVHAEKGELDHMLADDREVMRRGQPKLIPRETFLDARGQRRVLQTVKIPYTVPGKSERAVLGVAIDITDAPQGGNGDAESPP